MKSIQSTPMLITDNSNSMFNYQVQCLSLFCGTSVCFHQGTIDLHRKKTRQWWTGGIMDTNRGSFFPDSTIKPISTQEMERERSWRPCSSASSLISLLWLGELHLLSLSSRSSCQLSPSQNSSVTAIKQMLRCTRPVRTTPHKLLEVNCCALDDYFPISWFTVFWWRCERHGLFVSFYLSLLVSLVCAGICLPKACWTACVQREQINSSCVKYTDAWWCTWGSCADSECTTLSGICKIYAMLMVGVNCRAEVSWERLLSHVVFKSARL